MTKQVFMGGIPVSIDVEKINVAFGVPKKDTLIAYTDLESVTGLKKGSNRFETVVGSWRRKLRKEHNLVTEGVRGEGIMVLDDNRRVDHVGRKVAQGAKMLKKTYVTAATTPRDQLEPNQERKLDHQTRLLSALIDTGRAEEKKGLVFPDNPPRIWGGEINTNPAESA